MNTPLTPVICVGALACMLAAGASHWWSVQQITTAIHTTGQLPLAKSETPTLEQTPTEKPITQAPLDIRPAAYPAAPPVGEPLAMQQQFYQELISEMQQLRSQNRDLLNQVAETNRDLMNLEFRVDTHSDQFRPLPVAEEAFNASFGNGFDDGPGLLPPRAEPVILPFSE